MLAVDGCIVLAVLLLEELLKLAVFVAVGSADARAGVVEVDVAVFVKVLDDELLVDGFGCSLFESVAVDELVVVIVVTGTAVVVVVAVDGVVEDEVVVGLNVDDFFVSLREDESFASFVSSSSLSELSEELESLLSEELESLDSA